MVSGTLCPESTAEDHTDNADDTKHTRHGNEQESCVCRDCGTCCGWCTPRRTFRLLCALSLLRFRRASRSVFLSSFPIFLRSESDISLRSASSPEPWEIKSVPSASLELAGALSFLFVRGEPTGPCAVAGDLGSPLARVRRRVLRSALVVGEPNHGSTPWAWTFLDRCTFPALFEASSLIGGKSVIGG